MENVTIFFSLYIYLYKYRRRKCMKTSFELFMFFCAKPCYSYSRKKSIWHITCIICMLSDTLLSILVFHTHMSKMQKMMARKFNETFKYWSTVSLWYGRYALIYPESWYASHVSMYHEFLIKVDMPDKNY